MSHVVLKPFHASEARRVVNRDEPFIPSDEVRAGELERNGLIAPAPESKALPAAPQNKDAAKQRKNK